MASGNAGATLARRWLAEQATGGSYDPVAVSRLLVEDNPELRAVWDWLDKLEPQDCQTFVFAALNGLSGPDIRRTAGSSSAWRRTSAFLKRVSFVYAYVLGPRKGGARADYLRAFVGSLRDLSFPTDTRGTQSAIAKTANVVLNRDDITPQQVSAVFKSLL